MPPSSVQDGDRSPVADDRDLEQRLAEHDDEHPVVYDEDGNEVNPYED